MPADITVDFGLLARRSTPRRPGVDMPVDVAALPGFEPNQQELKKPKFPPRTLPGQIELPGLLSGGGLKRTEQ